MINTTQNYFFEKILDNRSVLDFTRTVCLKPSTKDAFHKRLDNSRTGDHPIYAKLCSSLLLAHEPETYKIAKNTIKSHLAESNEEGLIAELMLIYIKIFSPKKTIPAQIVKMSDHFLKLIDQAKDCGDYGAEFLAKSEYIEYLIHFSANFQEVEKGLQMQLSMIHELRMISPSQHFNVEKHIDACQQRYLKLLNIYFGGSLAEKNGEEDVKNRLSAIKNNPKENPHDRMLAEYHLAHLLSFNEFPKICDYMLSATLFKKLKQVLKKDNIYYIYSALGLENITSLGINIQPARINLAASVSVAKLLEEKAKGLYEEGIISNDQNLLYSSNELKEYALEIKSKLYFKLALSYLPSIPALISHFDVEKGWEYLVESLKLAHPSSPIIPLALMHLQSLCTVKKFDSQQINDFNDLIKKLSKSDKLNLKIGTDIILNLTSSDQEICLESNAFKQAIYFGSRTMLSRKTPEMIDFKHLHLDTLANDSLKAYPVKSKILKFYDIVKDPFLPILICHGAKLSCEAVKQEIDKNTIKTDYKINCRQFAQDIYKVFSKFEFEDDMIAIFTNFDKYIRDGELVEIAKRHQIPEHEMDKITIEVLISVMHHLTDIIENDKTNSKRNLLKEIHVNITKYINSYIKNSTKENSQEHLIFLINLHKMCLHHAKFTNGELASNGFGLATNYYLLSKYFEKGDTYNNLILESARWHHFYSTTAGNKNKNATWKERLKNILDLKYIDYYILSFASCQDVHKKINVIGKEILSFGPHLINEYIKESKENNNFDKKTPKSIQCLLKICVNLLYFNDKNEEADALVKNLTDFLLLSGIDIHEFILNTHFIIKTEKGISQAFDYSKYPKNLKNKMKKSEGVDWIPPLELKFSTQKLRATHQKTQTSQKRKTNESLIENIPIEVSPPISTTLESKQNAEILQKNQERKEQLKQNRTPKQSEIAQIFPQTISPGIEPKTRPILYLTPSCKKIYDEFWKQNSGALNKTNLPPFDANDYHNDIHMTKEEVIKLIKALGGVYHDHQAKGSHGKGPIPSIFKSSKVTWQDESVVFADFDDENPSSSNAILTKSPVMKKYQVLQLRKMFIKLGLTPDVVLLRI